MAGDFLIYVRHTKINKYSLGDKPITFSKSYSKALGIQWGYLQVSSMLTASKLCE
jgi:hypothetical protein